MDEWFMLPNHNMSTFEVFLSFSFCFIFMFTKTIHPLLFTRKLFFVRFHSYTWRTFFVYALELFFFMSHDLYANPIHIQRFLFSFFPTHTRILYRSFFIYTRRSHTLSHGRDNTSISFTSLGYPSIILL